MDTNVIAMGCTHIFSWFTRLCIFLDIKWYSICLHCVIHNYNRHAFAHMEWRFMSPTHFPPAPLVILFPVVRVVIASTLTCNVAFARFSPLQRSDSPVQFSKGAVGDFAEAMVVSPTSSRCHSRQASLSKLVSKHGFQPLSAPAHFEVRNSTELQIRNRSLQCFSDKLRWTTGISGALCPAGNCH